MERIIKIGEKECKFKTSASLPRNYRIKFRRDIFNDLNIIAKELKKGQDSDGSYIPPEVLTIFENIAFMMHRHGDQSQPSNIDKWLEQFETFDIYNLAPELLDMWGEENKTLVEQKKENQE